MLSSLGQHCGYSSWLSPLSHFGSLRQRGSAVSSAEESRLSQRIGLLDFTPGTQVLPNLRRNRGWQGNTNTTGSGRAEPERDYKTPLNSACSSANTSFPPLLFLGVSRLKAIGVQGCSLHRLSGSPLSSPRYEHRLVPPHSNRRDRNHRRYRPRQRCLALQSREASPIAQRGRQPMCFTPRWGLCSQAKCAQSSVCWETGQIRRKPPATRHAIEPLH